MKKDENKTKKQLMNELIEIKNKVAELETVETQRKRAEEALRESEKRYKFLVDNSKDIVLVLSKRGKILFANKTALHNFGYAEEELIGRSITNFLTKDCIKRALYALAQEFLGHPQPEMEFRTKTKNGEIRYLEFAKGSTPIREKGKLIGVMINATDITEHRQAEEALQKEKAYFDQLFDNAQEAIVVTDNDGQVMRVNSEFNKLFGYTSDEAVGKPVDELVAPKDLRNEAKAITKRIAEGKRVAIETLRQHKDGTKTHVSVLASPIIVDGKQVATYAIYRDITERKRAEEALQTEKAYIDQLFESGKEAIVMADNKGQVLRANSEFTKLFGYTSNEAVGKLLDELVAPKDLRNEAKAITKRIAEGQGVALEGLRQHKDGTLINVSIIGSPIIIGDMQVGQYAIYRDITERKRAEAIRNVLFNISKATTKTSNLDDLLATIHEQVGTLMDAKNFFVCLAYDTEKNLYTYPYYKDINPEDLVEPDEIIEITEGLTHHVLKTKKYLLGTKEELKKIGVIGTVPESWLGVPLKTESGDVNGVIAVQSYEKEAYSEEDAQVLSIIANNIGEFLKYKKAEEQIRSSLKEKEVLLKEIHHRVKNNMQIISSLLRLQSWHIKNKKMQEMFKVCQNRIKSMVLIHEKLYQSKDLARIDLSDYIRSLTDNLFSTYRVGMETIITKLDIEEVYLDVNTAIPLGLIINELVSNSLKYAFPEGRVWKEGGKSKGEIHISLCPDDDEQFTLVVRDNGVGLSKDLDFRNIESLGLQLVNDLVKQLDGSIELQRRGGTAFKITFKVPK